MTQQSPELKTAMEAAREATKVLLSYYNAGHAGEVKDKGKIDRVSEADLDAETIIRKILNEKFSNYNINGEELGESKKESEYVWYVDPLCGSNDFIRGFPEFGLSIALVRDKELILGVCSLPAFNELYWAEKGSGAFLNGSSIHVSKVSNPVDSIVTTHISAKVDDIKPSIAIVEKLARFYIKVPGSFPYAVCNLARGSSDVHVEINVSGVHSLAPRMIAEEAGAMSSKLDGNKLSVDDEEVVISNGLVHEHILGILK